MRKTEVGALPNSPLLMMAILIVMAIAVVVVIAMTLKLNQEVRNLAEDVEIDRQNLAKLNHEVGKRLGPPRPRGSSGRRGPACLSRGGLRLLLSRRCALRATPPRLPRPRTQRSFYPALQRACLPRPLKDTFPEATAFQFVAPRARRLRRRLLVKRFGRRQRKALGRRKRCHASQLLPSVGLSGELVRSVAPP